MGKGKLKFKGDKEPKKKKKKSKHSKQLTATVSCQIDNGDRPTEPLHEILSVAAKAKPQSRPFSKEEGPVIQKGKGCITSSGTVLMGHDTKFTSCINPGDAILVHVPTGRINKTKSDTAASIPQHQEEMRVVTIVLSNTSASISSAFSNDLRTPSEFKYISKPRNREKELMEKRKKDKLTKEEMERSAFGTYQSGSGSNGQKEFVYRERTEHGGYRIRRENVGSDSTRSDLLYMRSQKKSDKYC